jgi:hypothetical protein
METNNAGAWFNRNERRDVRFLRKTDEPPEGFVRARPLPHVQYQIYNEGTGAWEAHPDCETLVQIDEKKKELAAIDAGAGAGRAVRAVTLAAAAKSKITGGDRDILNGMEERAAALRGELAALVNSLGGGGAS